eukprot:69948-Amphidinium_carterae.1
MLKCRSKSIPTAGGASSRLATALHREIDVHVGEDTCCCKLRYPTEVTLRTFESSVFSHCANL